MTERAHESFINIQIESLMRQGVDEITITTVLRLWNEQGVEAAIQHMVWSEAERRKASVRKRIRAAQNEIDEIEEWSNKISFAA